MLSILEKYIYNSCNFTVSNFNVEKESKRYHACQFYLNNKKVISTNAKITPKKNG